MRKKRALALALSCLLLASCGAGEVLPLSEEPEAEGERVAYVPLDDRPDNVERSEYLAASLGYRLELPEAELYRTRLDGQPRNFDSLQRGEPWSLAAWVLDQEAAGCDRYILSLDQLHSGGLVSSRSMTGDEIELPGGGAASASQLVSDLLSALSKDEHNVVWLLDSVMRLAPTVGYEGGTLEEYNAIRAYGAEPRPAPSERWSVAAVEETYRLGADGRALDAASFGLTEEQVAAYLSARSRKLELTDLLLLYVNGLPLDNFHVLIGIDDSSEAESIQKNEIDYLKDRLRPGDALLSGVDDLAFKAIARLYLDECGWDGGTAAVRYYGGTEDAPACAYDSQPLEEIVAEHLDFFGLTESPRAGMQVLVLTQPADEALASAYYGALLEDLAECRERGEPVVLIDAGNGRYGTAFHEAAAREGLGGLLSYAGSLDMAIVTGTALSHGVARYARLTRGGPPGGAENRAFARTLADSILKDFCYRTAVRDGLSAYVRDLGGDPNNFYVPEIDRAAVLERLERDMAKASKGVIRSLERSRLLVSLEPEESVSWGAVEIGNYRFPWNRVFEIGMDIRLGPFGA